MTGPAASTPAAAPTPFPAPALAERGWTKLLIAIVALLFVPTVPQMRELLLPEMRAFLPVEQTFTLFVPAVAACALVGWWAGGRAFLAIAWMAIATLMTLQTVSPPSAFYNLVRGWSLLLAGSFGLVCLFGVRRSLFERSLLSLGLTLGLALVMSVLGPVTLSQASKTIGDEYTRRTAETMAALNLVIQTHPKEWADLSARVPQLEQLPAEREKELTLLANAGATVFPALLALQSIATLALAWAMYHRLSRARLGPPLAPLREFRFNDQLVWGLIVGLTIVLLPTLTALRGAGKNLLVFFGALYAVRGFGVLAWFTAPGRLGMTLALGFIMLFAPVLNAFAALGFMMLGVAALALGLGDTWADWRRRARPTS